MEEDVLNFDPDVIFIGAGPIGLWTAVQTKLLYKEVKILMIERKKVYERDNSLHVEMSSRLGTVNDPEFKRIIRKFVGNVNTNLIENELKTYASKLGIKIIYETITDPTSLPQRFPSVKAIIGSDGSHSIVRKTIFDDDFEVNYNLRHAVEVKYIIKDNGSGNNSLEWNIWSKTLNDCNHFVKENVSKQQDGNLKVSLRIFIDEKTYNKVSDATFKNPLNSSDILERDVNLYDTITKWINTRIKYLNDEIIGPIKISSIHLDVYKSKEIIKIINGIMYILVGDSAIGVPFFRSLNIGMLCGTVLAHKLCQYLNSDCDMYKYRAVSEIK